MDKAVEFLTRAVQQSLTDTLPEEIYGIVGYTSNRVKNLLNNIGKMKGCVFMEVGCWQGSTFVSALHGNPFAKAIAISNWEDMRAEHAKRKFYANMGWYLKPRFDDITVIDLNCWDVDVAKISQKVNYYFYDGDHERSSHRGALVHFYDVLHRTFIYVVDDFNDKEVQEGTYEAIKELKLNTRFMTYLPSRQDGDKANWWNGVGVFLLDKANTN